MDRTKIKPSANLLALFISRLKSFAEIADKLRISTDVLLVRGSRFDYSHVTTIVLNDFVESVICYYQDGPRSSHQAAKATTAKTARTLYLPGIKRDVKVLIGSCAVCDKNILNCTAFSKQCRIQWRRVPGVLLGYQHCANSGLFANYFLC